MPNVTFEDLQKENQTYFEEAEAYINLMHKYDLTQEKLSARLGKNQCTVSNKIRLLNLPNSVRKAIVSNNLSERHARALLRLHDEQLQLKVLDLVVRKKFNVKEIEELVEKAKKLEAKNDFINNIKSAIDAAKGLGIDVKVKQEDMGKYSRIIIHVSK